MRTYPIICPSCAGTGIVNQTGGSSSSSQRTCPACNGNKTVMCNETDGFFPKGGLTSQAKCPSCQGTGGVDLGRVYS